MKDSLTLLILRCCQCHLDLQIQAAGLKGYFQRRLRLVSSDANITLFNLPQQSRIGTIPQASTGTTNQVHSINASLHSRTSDCPRSATSGHQEMHSRHHSCLNGLSNYSSMIFSVLLFLSGGCTQLVGLVRSIDSLGEVRVTSHLLRCPGSALKIDLKFGATFTSNGQVHHELRIYGA
jgi:hypothetical protein